MDAVTIYATWPDLERAEQAGRALIERKLVACVNLVPGAISIYSWNDAVQRESEVVMFAKTRATRAAEARDALVQLHPYETPCITILRIDNAASYEPFLNWIAVQTS